MYWKISFFVQKKYYLILVMFIRVMFYLHSHVASRVNPEWDLPNFWGYIPPISRWDLRPCKLHHITLTHTNIKLRKCVKERSGCLLHLWSQLINVTSMQTLNSGLSGWHCFCQKLKRIKGNQRTFCTLYCSICVVH